MLKCELVVSAYGSILGTICACAMVSVPVGSTGLAGAGAPVGCGAVLAGAWGWLVQATSSSTTRTLRANVARPRIERGVMGLPSLKAHPSVFAQCGRSTHR